MVEVFIKKVILAKYINVFLAMNWVEVMIRTNSI